MVDLALRRDVLTQVEKKEPVEPEEIIDTLFPGSYCQECGTLQDQNAEAKVYAAVRELLKRHEVAFSADWKLVTEK